MFRILKKDHNHNDCGEYEQTKDNIQLYLVNNIGGLDYDVISSVYQW